MSELYVISEGLSGPVKVGRSVSANGRLYALQTGNPRSLRIVCRLRMDHDASVEAERMLLEELSHYRLVGEWLDLDERFMREYLPDFMLSNGFEEVA